MKDEPCLHVVFTPDGIQDGLIRETTVAVVDTLRATSVIPHALASGAVRIIPAESVEQATTLLASLDRDSTLLCGEREGIRISGFHLGNSPYEYTPDVVRGKTLIFCSTNGSRAMIRCQAAPEQVLASFVNASRAARRLADARGDVVLVCAGQQGRACLEDTVMCGLLVERLMEHAPERCPDDGAIMARNLWRHWEGDLAEVVRTATHGAYLASLGFEADLDFCSQLDSVPVLPILRNGRVEAEPSQPDSQASA